MSYDLYFFKMADGVSVDEINEFLDEMEEEDIGDVEDGSDEDEDESFFPSRFVNDELGDRIYHYIMKPYFRDADSDEVDMYLQDEDDRTVYHRWMKSDRIEPPEELGHIQEMMFEFAAEGGLYPMMVSMGADIAAHNARIAGILRDDAVRAQRIVVFDPQLGCVVGPENVDRLEESAEEAAEIHDTMLTMLQTGAPPYRHLIDEDTASRLIELEATPAVFELLGTNGETVRTIEIGPSSHLLFAQELLINAVEILGGNDTSIEEGAPSPAAICEAACLSLADEEHRQFDSGHDDYVRNLEGRTGSKIEFRLDGVCSRRFISRLFLGGHELEGIDTFFDVALLGMSLGAIGAFHESWVEQNPSNAARLQLAEGAIRPFCEAWDEMYQDGLRGRVRIAP